MEGGGKNFADFRYRIKIQLNDGLSGSIIICCYVLLRFSTFPFPFPVLLLLFQELSVLALQVISVVA